MNNQTDPSKRQRGNLQYDLHRWALKPEEAIKIQIALRARIVLAWDQRSLTYIAGVDVAMDGEQARAAIAVLSYPSLIPIESVTTEVPLEYPYIPGLLAFREGPAILAAWGRLNTRPDLLMFDGQGIAHPRGIGIASHMGLWMEQPTIGVAKSRLSSHYIEPGQRRGDYADLLDERQPAHVIGAVLRTRRGSKPLYISPGHLMDVPHALEIVLQCCAGHRLPEPLRWAHQLASSTGFPL